MKDILNFLEENGITIESENPFLNEEPEEVTMYEIK